MVLLNLCKLSSEIQVSGTYLNSVRRFKLQSHSVHERYKIRLEEQNLWFPPHLSDMMRSELYKISL